MSRLTLTKEQSMDTTVVSNYFIDDYMTQANEAQIKIYLYLLRLLSAGISTSISELADKYNYLESDVIRCVKYWEQKGLLQVSYDQSGSIREICFTHPAIADEKKQAQIILLDSAPVPMTQATSPKVAAKAEPEKPSIEKPDYTPSQLNQMKKEDDSFAELIFVAESYLGKTLSHTDCQTLAYIYNDLKLPADLIDYLIEYCVERGKCKMRYIETVAVSWANDNVTTVHKAKCRATRYDKTVYTILNALGRSEAPTETEAAYINRWCKEYAFHLDVILEACKKTVLATQSNRFQYTEGILTKWRAAGIHTLNDIAKEEERFNKEKEQKQTKKTATNSFNNIPKRDYDFEELEKKLQSI